MKASIIESNEFAPFYGPYIAEFGAGDLMDEMEISLHEFIRFVQEIPLGKHDYRYAEGKWTIKEIIQHIIDTERIFSYRALCIARNDKTPLPGFDENNYADETDANVRHLQSLLTEFSAVRESTKMLFKSFSEMQLLHIGTASNVPISVRAIGFITIGHLKHHQRIFKERYL